MIALIALGVWWYQSRPNAGAPSGEQDQNALENTASSEDLSAGSVNEKRTVSLSYATALATYKDARLQLDRTCQASPNLLTFKNGSLLMLDNRSPFDRTVKVGSVYNIKAWRFKIVRLSSAALPATWLVDCDKSQNVATVLIQK